ncbi:VOC family protein [Agrobacterium vitis]|uniref:VOC family protein n=1 Tax=Agrobacterium vitis TaxID=373 RepID=UPI0008730E4E|nr:VOC family protein [Agrobacterium vitis]MCE6077120.1 VOC family protein [Agrobacterium vitis]MCF1453179.1 VOC family protein [Agrobacterium vitis]MCM2453409.1 VOC family protein [Agrobacterium vitis]MCM2469157.1 VOC family protein [Agrobacterium vitis]MUO69440.1 VOC family protein [Agrobacterium vitis]
MTQRNDQIDYIEFNVRDISASKHFYATAFGWSFTDYGPDYAEFNDGRLKGGFTTTATVSATGGPLVILFADDLEKALNSVKSAGGAITRPIFSFPGGRRFHFRDLDGYELAVWSDSL